MEKIKRHKPHETFLVEYFGNDRSAAIYAGSLYNRIYYYENEKLVTDKMFFNQPRTAFETLAKQWVDMEIMNESQIDKLHKTIAGDCVRGVV